MDFLKRIQEYWNNSSSTQKSVSAVIVACLILALFFFYRWATKVEYATLIPMFSQTVPGKLWKDSRP